MSSKKEKKDGIYNLSEIEHKKSKINLHGRIINKKGKWYFTGDPGSTAYRDENDLIIEIYEQLYGEMDKQ